LCLCVVANILKISIRYLAGGKFCQGNCLGYKKSLNIPKGQSESVYVEEKQTTQWPKDRKTDNTMAKRQKNRQHNGQKTEEQTTQWPKEKVQKQRSTKHTHKTKDRVTLTPLKTGGELR
jgi:hypothetical protein